MRHSIRFLVTTSVFAALGLACVLLFKFDHGAGAQQAPAQPARQLSVAAHQQIHSILAEKSSRTPAQRKIGSQLLYAMREGRKETLTKGGEVHTMLSSAAIAKTAKEDAKGLVDVDLKGRLGKQVIQ